MFKFFSINYICYGLIFLQQIIIVRLFGQDVFGNYAVYLAFMALIEAPLISARSEAAIKILNASSDRLQSINTAVQKDFFNCLMLMPIIMGIIYAGFDGYLAILAWTTIAAQSGYAHLKSYLVVTDRALKSSMFELMISAGNIVVTLVAFLGLGFTEVAHLATLYFFSALMKNTILLATVNLVERKENKLQITTGSLYKPFSPILIIRAFSLNALTNLDVIIIATQASIEIVALYKIIKSLTGLAFRLIAPMWRWILYSSNKYILLGDLNSYHKSHLKVTLLGLFYLVIFMTAFVYTATDVIKIAYDIEVAFENWLAVVAFTTYVTAWFIAWFKVDMLFRSGGSATVSLPLLLATINGLNFYFIDDFSFKIYLSCAIQVSIMVFIFIALNTKNYISKKYPIEIGEIKK